jgi:transcriptional regulator with XRE-family HTH domain
MAVQRKRIPNMLKRYRKLAGYSQKDVAAILGFRSAARISSWERGSKFPSIHNSIALSVLYRTLEPALFFELYQLVKERILKAEKEFQEQKRITPSS